jgi:hypothetical protein
MFSGSPIVPLFHRLDPFLDGCAELLHALLLVTIHQPHIRLR